MTAVAAAESSRSINTRVHNFSAGPASLPLPVLKKVQEELLSYTDSCGCSVMEMSHRSAEFEKINREAEADLRSLLEIPDNYSVLFMPGGGTGQFACVPLNLLKSLSAPVDYIITGVWSQKAYNEAKLLGANPQIVFSTKTSNHNGAIPSNFDSWKFSQDAQYIYYCSNETVQGVEMNDHEDSFFDQFPANVPIVCDMSSNMVSRKFNVSRFGVIIAGVQKNIGPAGVTVVIIRNDLIRPASETPPIPVPTILNYRSYSETNSLYNTPPTFPIYVSGLVFKHLLGLGGLDTISQLNSVKSSKLYNVIEAHPTVYKSPLTTLKYASRMNVVFRVLGPDGQPNQERESAFVKQAESHKLMSLKGHRDVGGIRASLYNAVEMDSVEKLIAFMEDFAKRN